MIKEVRLPEIAENVDSGDVIKMLVSVGDVVEVDQPLVELETEKAVLEVPCPFKGTITEILVKDGDTITIDQVILKIDTSATAGASKSGPAQEPAPARKEPETQAPVKASATATPPIPGPTPGPTKADVRKAPAPTPVAVEPVDTPAPAQASAPVPANAPAASPSLRRFARELGVDLRRVTGTGPGGRILEDDLKSYARDVVSGSRKPVHGSAADDVTESTKWGAIVREPMSKVRQVTARTMQKAWSSIPHVTQYDKVDITELDALRKQYSRKLESSGGKLTMTAILLKVAASALKVFPQFNASIDIENKQIIYKRHYHIGVAVDTDRGLLVPVIRTVDKKNITELSSELNEVAQKARDRKLGLDEMDGGTFTISNLGGIGGTSFSPIVLPPQVAILGVARARMEPVHVNGQFEPRLILPLSVSYDHRLIDGADGARFLRWIARALEEPILLALEG
ncbi:MAG: 2-oxo acid dehydrogenase subunit E2 [bacterium]|nr:2-oxo acid dehydrogenase subunit E2 [bacterium]